MGETPWAQSPSNARQPLTPDRVRNKDFSRAKLGSRGFNVDEVRNFLYRMAEDMTASDMEKAELRAEVDRLKNWYKDHGTDTTNPGATQQARLNVDAVNLLSRAQQTADAQIAEAEDYARRLVGQARQQYEQILQESQQRAEEAASQAVNVYRSSGEVHSVEAEELERRIAYLRTFAEVTQVQLRAVLEGLANEVNKLGALPETSRNVAAYSSLSQD
ncbi:DivIVA domain-containing protein [Nonomuraea sp. NEAU-A123]|uniref:DivIVA domain-containing protein n=1 Tax=Nonomuraea sp. NEAU-A123 TaxID=2839649 RepID=UPI001BE3F7B9|nr:DivIVA domain-containing protein [Nonomuraea sp. NEAU-A123]MBT2231077.1 DivIVA domain-containing protein [Nonomuraea sp. NEAU-A123]